MNKPVKALWRAYQKCIGYYPIVINGLTFKVDTSHLDFWRRVTKGRWEPQTYKIMSTFLNADSVYFDIGAWIGPTVIYAAKICRRVVCFEPDPVAYQFLRQNILLNELDNVASFSIALSNETAIQRMSSFGENLGDSGTSLLQHGQVTKSIDVVTLTWDTFIDIYKTNKIDFLKIDIEGGEFALLPAMRDYLSLHKPIVYLSTHAPFLDVGSRREKMRRIIDVMGIYKRCLDEHLRPVDIRTLDNEDALNRFHSYVFMD